MPHSTRETLLRLLEQAENNLERAKADLWQMHLVYENDYPEHDITVLTIGQGCQTLIDALLEFRYSKV